MCAEDPAESTIVRMMEELFSFNGLRVLHIDTPRNVSLLCKSISGTQSLASTSPYSLSIPVYTNPCCSSTPESDNEGGPVPEQRQSRTV